MTMIHGSSMTVKMHVPHPAMIMVMQMPAFANQFQPEHTTEYDEHEPHSDFRRNGDRAGYRDTKGEHDCADEEQDDGMPDAPAQAYQTRCPPGRPLGEHRRDGDKMVRVQGMSQPEDKAKPQNRRIRGISHRAPAAFRTRGLGRQ
jgi:hypothetical protein